MARVPDRLAVRSWPVIPVMAVASGGAAVALGLSSVVALVGAALAGAALAAAIRALAGDGPGALMAAVVAPLLAVASLAGGELGGAIGVARGAIGVAAAAWTVAELARGGARAALVAVLPATLAAVLDPSFVALIAIAGARLMRAPARPRWAVAVLVVGCVAVAVAALAGTAWGALGDVWFGGRAHPVPAAALAARAADALGPLTAVAGLAGLLALGRARWAELAVVAAVVGCAAVDLRAGALGAATVGVAALLAGLAIARLAALIRIPVGQAVAAALCGVLVIVPPAWTATLRAPAAHIGQASR